MRLISTRLHGYLDYAVGLLLIAAPYLFGFAQGGPAQWVPISLGVLVIVYSLLTRYELGLFGVIPMPAHLVLDVAGGALLAMSPWLFLFSDRVYLPHVLVGVAKIVVAVMTKPLAETSDERAGRQPLANAAAIGVGLAVMVALVAVFLSMTQVPEITTDTGVTGEGPPPR